jgi:hypothetical protein
MKDERSEVKLQRSLLNHMLLDNAICVVLRVEDAEMENVRLTFVTPRKIQMSLQVMSCQP